MNLLEKTGLYLLILSISISELLAQKVIVVEGFYLTIFLSIFVCLAMILGLPMFLFGHLYSPNKSNSKKENSSEYLVCCVCGETDKDMVAYCVRCGRVPHKLVKKEEEKQ